MQEIRRVVGGIGELQVWLLPVPAADHAAAGWRSALAVHHAVVVIEQGVVGGQLLAGLMSRMATRTVLPAKPTFGRRNG